jgi:L-arabinose isomerase
MGQVRQRLLDITEDEINSEMREDLTIFIPDKYDEQTHHRTAKADIMVRKWIEENDLMAFTFNFANIEKRFGFECVPFIEACKAMGRGIGYAGEGDVLTAVLCGAMLRAFPETSFAEMFCPDWKGNGIFLSHMGEMNNNTAKGKMKLTEKEYGFSDADNPMAVYGGFKPGDAVLMNLAPMGDSNYSLILSRITVLDVARENRMKDSIHGWIQPHMPIDEFLKQYSLAGGTHHLVMIYGDDILDKVRSFGEMMGFHVEVI